jgi:hypothetical protein
MDVTVTPLPAALPLFATGLGALGLLGWRRKKKAALIEKGWAMKTNLVLRRLGGGWSWLAQLKKHLLGLLLSGAALCGPVYADTFMNGDFSQGLTGWTTAGGWFVGGLGTGVSAADLGLSIPPGNVNFAYTGCTGAPCSLSQSFTLPQASTNFGNFILTRAPPILQLLI